MPPGQAVLAAAHQVATTGGHGATGAQSVAASSLLIQMVIGLAVIIGLIKVVSRVVQGKGGRALSHARRQGGVSVLGRQSLGKGVQVAVVSAARRTYLIGVTQRQITLLGQLDGAQEAVAAPGQALAIGDLQLIRSEPGPDPGDDLQPSWRAAIDQMRDKTLRRA